MLNKNNFVLYTSTFAISTLLLLNGCGSTSTVKDDDIHAYKIQSLPSDISIEIPDALKGIRIDSNSVESMDAQSDGQSLGYKIVKQDILMVEEYINRVKFNLYFIDTVMDTIKKECEGITINTVCTIASGKISYTLNDSIIEGAINLMKEINPNAVESLKKEMLSLEGTSTPLGKISYTKYDEGHTYLYELKIDTSTINDDLKKDIETIRWAENQDIVEIINETEELNGYANDMTITYVKEENGQKQMQISDKFSGMAHPGEFSLQMHDLYDDNNTITMKLEHIFGDFNTSTSSKIDKNGGYMLTSGSDTVSEFKEKESFDKDGKLLESAFCFSLDDGCDINDESTWNSDNSDIFQIEDDDFFSKEQSIYDGINIEIVSGNLEDGAYVLMYAVSDVNWEALNYVDIMDNRAGTIYIVEGEVSDLTGAVNLERINEYRLVSQPQQHEIERSIKALTKDESPVFEINDIR